MQRGNLPKGMLYLFSLTKQVERCSELYNKIILFHITIVCPYDYKVIAFLPQIYVKILFLQ